MSRWFRMYDEMLDDPKVQMLPPELFKTWVNMLALASRSGGALPSIEKMAFALRVSNHDMQTRVDELILLGLIDITADGRREPHNWRKRQWKSDDSADRVRRHRERKRAETGSKPLQETECNGDVTVTVTPPETESDTEKKEDKTPLPPDGGLESPNTHLEALKAFEAYNARALLLGLPQASKLTPDRKRRISARLRDFGQDGWTKALANLDTPFLRGLTEHRFRADLDFVCQPKSFSKLHDGGYAPAQTPAPGVTHDEAARSRPSRYPTKHDRLQAVVAKCLERNAGPAQRPEWARDLDGDALAVVPGAKAVWS